MNREIKMSNNPEYLSWPHNNSINDLGWSHKIVLTLLVWNLSKGQNMIW